ncbi:MAG: hypothetical protein WC858_05015 [Parcubacteria group bacterium]
MTSDQKKQFIDATYGDLSIKTQYSENDKGRALVEKNVLPGYESKYNSYDDALKALKSSSTYGGSVKTGDAMIDNINSKEISKEAGETQSKASWYLAPVTAVLQAIAWFMKEFVAIAAQILDMMLNPNIYNLNNQPVINTGWTTVRDVCNLFFLLILLFISFCTILQIDKYHIKKTLLTLVIMALLINFSKPIAIFIFDGSQLLMNFFLNAMGKSGGFSAAIANKAKIAEIVYTNARMEQSGSDTEIIVNYLFAIIFCFMFGLALLIMAIYLLIRLVAIWILIIVSPFAFFAQAFPDFKKMSSDWWDALFKYSYFGPVMAFFLFLSTTLAYESIISTKTAQGGSSFFTYVIQTVLPYMIVLVFLYASLIVSQKFGIQFAGAITSRANKVMNRAAKAGAMGALTVGTFGGYQWGRDAYQGARKGVSQSPGWRMLTKEGREAKSKERQGKWEERFAPLSMARVQKNAKELENVDLGIVQSGVKRGDSASILEAARRGKITDRELASKPVRDLINKNADFEAAVYKNLRNSGNGHLQYSDLISRGKTATDTYEKTFKDMSINNLADQNKLDAALTSENAAGGTQLYTKLNALSTLPDPERHRRVGPLLSKAKDPDTIAVLTRIYNGLPPI